MSANTSRNENVNNETVNGGKQEFDVNQSLSKRKRSRDFALETDPSFVTTHSQHHYSHMHTF